MWIWVFWIAAGYILYTYVGYAALLHLWRLASRRAGSPPELPEYTPRLAVILTARNEEASIGDKLRDLQNQDYPRDLIEIWVASDQSTDRTNEIVSEITAEDPRVRLIAYDENIGKAVAINRTIPLVDAEVVILSDARQRVDAGALRKLARHFADPRVGLVGAEMTLVNAEGRPSGECTGLYWRYERALRRVESSLGLLTGVSGAFLAVRRSVFRDIPPGSYCEDVTLALYARCQGFLVRWEPGARVYEKMREPLVEFRRKVRTLVGNYQLLSQFWPLYMPWRGRLAFTLISHKLCRLFTPVALLLMLCASAFLAVESPVFLVLLIGQGAFYGAGAIALLRSGLRRFRMANAVAAFCMLNWAAAVALIHVLRFGPRIQWK